VGMWERVNVGTAIARLVGHSANHVARIRKFPLSHPCRRATGMLLALMGLICLVLVGVAIAWPHRIIWGALVGDNCALVAASGGVEISHRVSHEGYQLILPVIELRRLVVWPECANPAHVILPLWLPGVALLSAGTALLWHRRRPREGYCSTCGYNLTGNVSGRCPECGTPMATSGPRPWPADGCWLTAER
jgi:hypothetical protein